jgi:anti-sigma regulatory factor (Ser/Thr protein kinase)
VSTAEGIQRRVPAHARQLPLLRRAAVEFVADRCPAGNLLDRVALAVTEACSNVIQHAYPAGGGILVLDADVVDTVLIITVTDYGVGMEAPSAKAGLGVGLRLLNSLADTRIRRDGGTVVEMRFRVPAEHAGWGAG